MKKAFSAILAILAVISITACGEKNSDRSSASGSTAQESSASEIELPEDKFE